MWCSLPKADFNCMIASSDFSMSSIGSPPVIPVPVAFIALASSITSLQSLHLRSLANISGDSRRLSESGQ